MARWGEGIPKERRMMKKKKGEVLAGGGRSGRGIRGGSSLREGTHGKGVRLWEVPRKQRRVPLPRKLQS